MHPGNGELMRVLGEARKRTTDASSTLDALAELLTDMAGEDDAAAIGCRGLVDLLGADAAWVAGADGIVASHRSLRSGSAPIPDVHPIELAAAFDGEAVRRRDGRRSLALAPATGGRVVIVAARATRAFSDRDMAVARAVAAALPVAVASTQTGDPMAFLHDLSGALLAAESEADVAQAVVAQLRRAVHYDSCRFYLLDEARAVAAPMAVDGVGEPYVSDRFEDLECRVGEGIAGTVVARCEPLLLDNANGHPLAAAIPGSEPMDESVLALPLVGHTGALGAIVLTREGIGRFGADDRRLLEVAAAQAAAACASARVQARTREAAEIAEGLLELGAVLSMPSDLAGIANLLVRSVDRMVECAAIQLWLREGDHMELAGQLGHIPAIADRLTAARLPTADAPFADALDSRSVTVRSTSEAGGLTAILGGLPNGSTLSVVALGERAANRGAIVVQRGPRRGPPSERDRRMLSGIADQALMAITNMTLYRDLERSFLETVQALANALETKDEYTGDHAQALIGLCTTVASLLGVAGSDLRDVSFAAALHDIGKIGIPHEILNKPGPLTPAEFEVMKRHPELGARIIEPVAALAGARELVAACHEHWDGSGYPLALAGVEIPLGARVILACDAFHAMTTDRVYRPAMSLPDAVAELRRCAGSHFDPDVVAALIDTIVDAAAAPQRQPASVA